MKEKVKYDLITSLVLGIKNMKDVKIETPDDNTFILKVKDSQVGKINYNYETEDLLVEGDVFIKMMKDIISEDKKVKEFFTEENLKKTTMPDLLKDLHNYNGLDKSIDIFEGVNDIFKKLKISKVYMYKEIDKRTEILKTLSLFINPSIRVNVVNNPGYKARSIKVLFKDFPHSFKTEDKLNGIVSEGNSIKPIGEEVVEKIMLYNYEVGHYFRNRNLIVLFFNPFGLNKINPLMEEVPKIFYDLEEEFKRLGVKKENTDEIIRQNFITNFMSSASRTLDEKESAIRSLDGDIRDIENRLVTKSRDRLLYISNIEHLKRLISTGGKDMLKDLDKLDKLPFLIEYKLNNDSLELVYKPTFITMKDFKRDGVGKSYGARKIYVGQITMVITPGDVRVKSDTPMLGGHPHTHANDNGNPCFGDGDAASKIRSFRIENKFAELASMLWFWIQTHRDGGAYIKMNKFYDDRLRQGLPVLDEKGELIVINDKDKISSGEQIALNKTDKYDDNIKRTKEFMEANK